MSISNEKRVHPQFIESIEKGMRVLELFRDGRSTVGLTELVEGCDITKSAAQRLTHTWCELGYLVKDEQTRRYSLTHKTLELGFLYLNASPLITRAMPILKLIRDKYDVTVNLSLLSGADIVYIARLPGPGQTVTEMLPGRRMPAWSTSAGRVLLSTLADDQIQNILATTSRIRYTEKTQCDSNILFQEIKLAQKQGYAMTLEQIMVGQSGIAAPVRNVHHQIVAAVNITTRISQWPTERINEELLPLLMTATQSGIV
ncbi:IclR family transcriptional regulator [Rahnella woolbedingensis]|uniref:IclR family transcriptional regulator n=1 Tax=Rahnella woolbedingensis TaxID=1510574 RepID=A0A419N7W1_9GAMM|nr:IclR family transcriptional regulator [Rahnella woolbedingensis]RJT43391.1 IclR family transcriptional regulator [Rahnella woolbedingensis]